MELRQYQIDAIEKTLRALDASGSAIMQMPTGAGKTKTAVAIIERHDGIVWFIVHRREIERQTCKTLADAVIDFGVVSPRGKPDYSKRVQVISVGLLKSRMGAMPVPSLVIWDECHHAAAKTWSGPRAALADAKHLGLTATPERYDGKGLREWFGDIVPGPAIQTLVDEGHLSAFRYFAPSDPDLTAAKFKAGDYNRASVAKIMNTPVLIGDAIREYKAKMAGKRAIVFASSVEAGEHIAARFNADGVPAAHVDGTTKDTDREQAVADLAAGRIKVLSNVEVFTEGFDLPAIDGAILMRPTRSPALFLQMIRRALRKADDKPEAIILDHAGLYRDHGWFASPVDWSIDGVDGRVRRKAGERGPRKCPKCVRVRGERIEVCSCGYEFPTGRDIGEFDGELREVIGKAPEGCVTVSDFARRHGTSTGGVCYWVRRGLKKIGAFVPLIEGDKWVLENVNSNDPRKRQDYHKSGEYESQAKFAARIGMSASFVSKCISRGLPNKNRWIHINNGIDWVRNAAPPKKSITIKEYAAEMYVSVATIRNWIILGMPAVTGKAPARVARDEANEWVKKNKKGIDLRMSICRNPATGWLTRPMFAEAVGVSAGTVTKWKSLGLPCNHLGHINLEEGMAWIGENSWTTGFGAESQAIFGRRVGVEQATISTWKKAGLPCVTSGWVHIQRGLEWVHDNRPGIAIPPDAWPDASANDNAAQSVAA